MQEKTAIVLRVVTKRQEKNLAIDVLFTILQGMLLQDSAKWYKEKNT